MQHSAKKNGFLLWMGVFIMILLVIFDQFTKFLAVRYLKDAPAFPVLSGVFELSYLENYGAAFGMLQGQKNLFIIMTTLTLAVLIYLYIRIPKEKRYFYLYLLLILLIPGAVGNFIDRCTHNYVIDFFYFKLIHFPVFNMADIYVSAATVLLVILFCFYYKEEEIDMLLKQLLFWKKEKKEND